jgi:hypothetical protein
VLLTKHSKHEVVEVKLFCSRAPLQRSGLRCLANSILLMIVTVAERDICVKGSEKDRQRNSIVRCTAVAVDGYWPIDELPCYVDGL